jgi:tetratricopeptide (TPR) repeat protein
VLAVDKRYAEAAREYADCAQRAESAGIALIAIEGWRLAGQLALSVGSEREAVSCFREAIRVAEGSEAKMVSLSSASDAARALAACCQAKGLLAQADSLYAQADAMERGEVGTVSIAAEV